MADNGKGTKEQVANIPNGTGMVRRTRQPLFEKDLMTAGNDILNSLPTAVFRDEQALNDACLYLGWLEMHDLTDEIDVALWKINGTMAIDGRARDDAVQAHGQLYFPRHASKEDKKYIAMMQQQMAQRTNDNDSQVIKG